MADRNSKLPENVPGPFYVDECCTDCDACRATAPGNFARMVDKGYCYVAKQPANDAELQLCLDALEGCPHLAIGQDGELPVEAKEKVAARPRSVPSWGRAQAASESLGPPPQPAPVDPRNASVWQRLFQWLKRRMG